MAGSQPTAYPQVTITQIRNSIISAAQDLQNLKQAGFVVLTVRHEISRPNDYISARSRKEQISERPRRAEKAMDGIPATASNWSGADG
jgi:hypothetical protein